MNSVPQTPQDESWKFRFNKAFDSKTWLEMEPPPHITESDWLFAVSELHVFLTKTEAGQKEPDKLILGWKLKYGLL
jgi:hypothetical protein